MFSSKERVEGCVPCQMFLASGLLSVSWLVGKQSRSTGSWTERMKRIPRDHPVPDVAPDRVSSRRKLLDCCTQTCSRTMGMSPREDAPVLGTVTFLGRLSPELIFEVKQWKSSSPPCRCESQLQRRYWVLKYLLRTHLCDGAEAVSGAAPQTTPSLPIPSQSTCSQWKAEPYPTIQSFMNVNSGLCWTAEGNGDPESGNISVDLIANGSLGCSWEHQSPNGPRSPSTARGPQHQHHPVNWGHGTVWEKHAILWETGTQHQQKGSPRRAWGLALTLR